jgi:type 1 glutamine amidotransferase
MSLAAVILVVTATAGFRHDSIPTAEEVIARLAPRLGASVVYARGEDEMARMLNAEALRGVNVVMFVNTTGELDVPRRDDLLQWIAGGGSFIGVHSASDTWHEWPAYIDMLGAEFESHPDQYVAQIDVVDAAHPATAQLASPHAMLEEIYNLKNFDAARVRPLLATDGRVLAWSKDYGAGRVFYTTLGHRIDVWESEWFASHLFGAMSWALRRDELPRRRAVAP